MVGECTTFTMKTFLAALPLLSLLLAACGGDPADDTAAKKKKIAGDDASTSGELLADEGIPSTTR